MAEQQGDPEYLLVDLNSAPSPEFAEHQAATRFLIDWLEDFAMKRFDGNVVADALLMGFLHVYRRSEGDASIGAQLLRDLADSFPRMVEQLRLADLPAASDHSN